MSKSYKNPFLHGARGIFAFSVLLFHIMNSSFQPIFPKDSVVNLAGASLQYGVELFFGISGIVIIGAHARARTTTQFILERCARIYPVLWATVAAILAFGLLTHKPQVITPDLAGLGSLVVNLLAVPNIVPVVGDHTVPIINPAAWTLTFEFCFYGLVGLFLTPERAWRPLSGLVIVVAGVVLISLQFRAIFFLSGIAIYAGAFERGLLLRLSRYPVVWLPIFLFCWTLGIARLGLPTGLSHLAQSGVHDPLLPVLIAGGWLSGSLALAGIVRGEGLLGRLCLTAPVQWLGTVSYSLYLWQGLIGGGVGYILVKYGLVVHVGNFGKVVLLLSVVPPALLVAKLSQQSLEVKVTNWLRRKIESR